MLLSEAGLLNESLSFAAALGLTKVITVIALNLLSSILAAALGVTKSITVIATTLVTLYCAS
jgi:hypothetical protein